MKKLILALAVLGFIRETQAAVSFQCYSTPGSAVQTYEYGSSNCGGVDSSATAAKVAQDGVKDMLCVYTAVCRPVHGSLVGKEPDSKQIPEIASLVRTGTYKPSILMCKGTGTITRGIVNGATCPTPTQCQQDVFFNFANTGITPPLPIGISTKAQSGASQ